MNRVKMAIILGILAAPPIAPVTLSMAGSEETAGAMHAHLSGVSCDDVAPNEQRPDFENRWFW